MPRTWPQATKSGLDAAGPCTWAMALTTFDSGQANLNSIRDESHSIRSGQATLDWGRIPFNPFGTGNLNSIRDESHSIRSGQATRIRLGTNPTRVNRKATTMHLGHG